MNSKSSSTMSSRSTSAMTPVMLPEIRTMSPLQVPRPSQVDSAITASSHETFTTAFTSTPSPSSPVVSPFQPTPSTNDTIMHTPPAAALLPPHSLRKSISVDSFISSRRLPDSLDAGPSSPAQQRDYSRESGDARRRELNDTPDRITADANPRMPTATRSFTSRLFNRTRGHSLSGPSIEYDDPYLDDSEHEHASDLVQLPMLSSQRSQISPPSHPNGLMKAKARSRLNNDGLVLPPRSSLSSTSPLPSTSTTLSTTPTVPLIPVSHSRRPVPNPLVLPSTRHILSATKAGRTPAESRESLSIGVVGTFGCGKTSMIKRGLKVWGVSEESVSTIATARGRIRYGVRTINASREDDITASVIEVDSDNLTYDTPDGAWPEGLPHINGVLVLYDASDLASYVHVPELMAAYHSLQLPVIVVACKCDLEIRVSPEAVSDRAKPYGIGLIEVSVITDIGRHKMRYAFKWLLRSIEQAKRGDILTGPDYPNPASPDALAAPWSEGHYSGDSRTSFTRSRMGTPTGGSPSTAMKLLSSTYADASPTKSSSTPTPRPSGATSPTRVKSVSDLMTEVEKNRQEEREIRRQDSHDGRSSSLNRSSTFNGAKRSGSSSHGVMAGSASRGVNDQVADKTQDASDRSGSNESKDDSRNSGKKEAPSMPWATLEELLDKLFFLAVSGDDPTFIKHFLLTYRKFATPRTVLLGMQKRIRQLNKDFSDLLLGNYAQMRICDLLEEWISTYPTDFATPGTHGALVALVKHISSNPCTLHYGSDLLPFLDELPRLKDLDCSWALPCEDPTASDESDTLLEEGETVPFSKKPKNVSEETVASSVVHSSGKDSSSVQSKPKSTTRERKASFPLSTKALTSSPTNNESPRLLSSKAPSAAPRNSLRDLMRLSQTLNTYDLEEFAQQITKMQKDLFLAIEPRQWLRYAMSDTRPQNDPISICANFYNHLAYWVSSLILAHDRVRTREKQVERFVDLAQRLRYLNNYVGLRAVMTGINNATYPNDEIMSLFRDSKIRLYQQYLGWEILLNSQHNHRAYRMALRNTDGPAIPDMEVHTFDMVRANDSNPNHRSNDPTLIHWGKFTLMARMILVLQGLQEKIRGSRHFDFPERKWIREMIENEVMDLETIQSRVFVPPDDAEPIFPWSQGPESPSTSKSDSARFRKIFFSRLK